MTYVSVYCITNVLELFQFNFIMYCTQACSQSLRQPRDICAYKIWKSVIHFYSNQSLILHCKLTAIKAKIPLHCIIKPMKTTFWQGGGQYLAICSVKFASVDFKHCLRARYFAVYIPSLFPLCHYLLVLVVIIVPSWMRTFDPCNGKTILSIHFQWESRFYRCNRWSTEGRFSY